ncbi:MAG: zinc-dependent peptidase [Tenacibaculum sp.]
MKPFFVIKYLTIIISVVSAIVNIIESVYVYFFNKPIFVHFYLVKKKLPKNKKEFLINGITFYKQLNDKHKKYFEHRLARFIRTYDFIERDGCKLTPEAKVLIASSYIKLTFGMRRYLTTTFDKIVVYPTSFYSQITKQYHKGEYNPKFKMIIFSWEDFLLGDLVVNDNLNLGIHEFTHALTFHGKKSKDVSARIFYKIFAEITAFMDDENNLAAIKSSNYFRAYGFTNKLEFVAVIMEHFFETPDDLQQKFPILYLKIEKMINYKSIQLKS